MNFSILSRSTSVFAALLLGLQFFSVSSSFADSGENSWIVPQLGAEFLHNSSDVKELSRTVSVLRVTSDAMSGYLNLQVEMDSDSNLTAIKYETFDPETSIVPKTVASFTIDQMASGFVIYKDSGYDIVKLVGPGFTAHSGGPVQVVFLKNALLGTHGKVVIDLERSGDNWTFNANDQGGHHKVTNMFLKKNSIWGKTVGISDVTVQ